MAGTELKAELESARAEITHLQAENVTLRLKVEQERQRVVSLESDIVEMRRTYSTMGREVEQEEEKISNVLLKKIDTLQKERAHILRAVEEEEEYITNTLQKKLDQVRREKVEIENALEQEQEFIVNKLMAELNRKQAQTRQLEQQIEQMRKEKVDLENTLEFEQEAMVNRLQKRLEQLELERTQLQRQLSRSPHTPRAHNDGDRDAEVAKLQSLLQENEKKQHLREQEFKADQEKLKDENLHLRQRVAFELERCKGLERDLTQLEREMEMEEEKQFNLLTSPHSHGKGSHTPPIMLRSLSSTSPRTSLSLGRVPSLDTGVPLGARWWTKRSEPHSHVRRSIDAGEVRRKSSDNGSITAGRCISAEPSSQDLGVVPISTVEQAPELPVSSATRVP